MKVNPALGELLKVNRRRTSKPGRFYSLPAEREAS